MRGFKLFIEGTRGYGPADTTRWGDLLGKPVSELIHLKQDLDYWAEQVQKGDKSVLRFLPRGSQEPGNFSTLSNVVGHVLKVREAEQAGLREVVEMHRGMIINALGHLPPKLVQLLGF